MKWEWDRDGSRGMDGGNDSRERQRATSARGRLTLTIPTENNAKAMTNKVGQTEINLLQSRTS